MNQKRQLLGSADYARNGQRQSLRSRVATSAFAWSVLTGLCLSCPSVHSAAKSWTHSKSNHLELRRTYCSSLIKKLNWGPRVEASGSDDWNKAASCSLHSRRSCNSWASASILLASLEISCAKRLRLLLWGLARWSRKCLCDDSSRSHPMNGQQNCCFSWCMR